MEKAKSADASVWAKTIRDVCNAPGEEVDGIVAALEMVRSGKDVNFTGAGATVDCYDNGDQINRTFLHQVIEGGKNRIVGVIS